MNDFGLIKNVYSKRNLQVQPDYKKIFLDDIKKGGDPAVHAIKKYEKNRKYMREALIIWTKSHKNKPVDLKNKFDIAMVQWLTGQKITGKVDKKFVKALVNKVNDIKKSKEFKLAQLDNIDKSKEYMKQASGAILVAGSLVANDVTVIGVGDDIAVPPAVLYAAAMLCIGLIYKVASKDIEKSVSYLLDEFVKNIKKPGGFIGTKGGPMTLPNIAPVIPKPKVYTPLKVPSKVKPGGFIPVKIKIGDEMIEAIPLTSDMINTLASESANLCKKIKKLAKKFGAKAQIFSYASGHSILARVTFPNGKVLEQNFGNHKKLGPVVFKILKKLGLR